MTDEEVLDTSIELLRQGWAKGHTYTIKRDRWRPWRKHYSYCATGAVTAAVLGAETCDYLQVERLVDLLDDKAWEVSGRQCGSVAGYNDHHARDVEDVITIFEKVKADLP